MIAGRLLFCFALVLSWANSAMHVALADRPLYAMSGRVREEPAIPNRLPAILVASAAFVGLVITFYLGIHVEWIAALILLSLIAIRRFEIRQWPGDIVVRLGKYVPAGACLLAWLIAAIVLTALGFPTARAHELGWQASAGVLAGAYVLAAIAKLRETGLDWMNPGYQALLVAERAFSGPPAIRSLRAAIARSRLACQIVGSVGFFAEFLAAGFIFPPARPVVLAAVIALHLGFIVLLGYFEPEWVAVMIAVFLLAS
jgi:hypothetical protein